MILRFWEYWNIGKDNNFKKLQVLETPLWLLPINSFEISWYVVVSEINHGESSIPNIYLD